jgi:hypothetical protein
LKVTKSYFTLFIDLIKKKIKELSSVNVPVKINLVRSFSVLSLYVCCSIFIRLQKKNCNCIMLWRCHHHCSLSVKQIVFVCTWVLVRFSKTKLIFYSLNMFSHCIATFYMTSKIFCGRIMFCCCHCHSCPSIDRMVSMR